MNTYRLGLLASLLLPLLACSPALKTDVSEGHLSQDDAPPAENIPQAVSTTPLLPKPVSRPALETYTVVVNNVPVRDLLFSMARDAKLNVDLASDINGSVTLNAVDQTLPQILERISRQTDIQYELDGNTLRVGADMPQLRTYRIDYLNMSRDSKGQVSVSTSVGTTGGAAGTQGGGSQSGNDSSTEMSSSSKNQLWGTLTRNIAAMIGDKVEGGGANEELVSTPNVIVNRESGVIAVNTTAKKHQQVQAFIDEVLNSARRQVLIEATIAEITLSDRYQSGVDWSLLANDPSSGVSFTSDVTGANLEQAPYSLLTITDTVGDTALNISLKALEQFGDVQVLSSPKVMALNNQTAMLKVVDNIVYFDIEVNTTVASNSSVALTTYETNINTVPVGFVMSVTPFINDSDSVTLNVRPTISRVIDHVNDPNPSLAAVGVTSQIPVIQVREIESLLKISNGDTAIIGGLMQDVTNNQNTGIPILSNIPWLGKLFSYEDDKREKSELVIFIRPVVVKQASLNGDLSEYRQYLPAASEKKNQGNTSGGTTPQTSQPAPAAAAP
jgi:general secretion pathway protein D